MKHLFIISFTLFHAFVIGQNNYTQLLAEIKKDRLSMASQKINYDSCKTYFLQRFERDLFPYWVGTRWDYNGYTNTPGEDKVIACGYFVSTTLKHMGFNWNRYDLAKMYSRAMVQQTCSDIIESRSIDSIIAQIKVAPDNLYMVGLDNHVGLILKRGQNCWFVHSNYVGSVGPEKEVASESRVLHSSGLYVLGTFLNEENIQKWLSGKAFVFHD